MNRVSLYQQMLDDIRSRRWPVGQPLKQQQLAERYQTSRIPVRDALARLAAEGWLQPCGKASLQVPPLSAGEAAELCLIRQQLEPLALRLAGPALSFSVLGAAEDCLQLAAAAGDDPLRQGELNWQFHCLLYQPCERPVLLQLLAQLHQKVEMYLGFQQVSLGYQQRSHAEHLELLALLRQRDIEAAVSLLQQHIAAAASQLALHLQNNPELR